MRVRRIGEVIAVTHQSGAGQDILLRAVPVPDSGVPTWRWIGASTEDPALRALVAEGLTAARARGLPCPGLDIEVAPDSAPGLVPSAILVLLEWLAGGGIPEG